MAWPGMPFTPLRPTMLTGQTVAPRGQFGQAVGLLYFIMAGCGKSAVQTLPLPPVRLHRSRWRPCGVTWDADHSQLRRTSAFIIFTSL